MKGFSGFFSKKSSPTKKMDSNLLDAANNANEAAEIIAGIDPFDFNFYKLDSEKIDLTKAFKRKKKEGQYITQKDIDEMNVGARAVKDSKKNKK